MEYMVKLSSDRLIIKEGLRNKDYKILFEFFKDIDSIKYMTLADKFMAFKNPEEIKNYFEIMIKKEKLSFYGIYKKRYEFIGYIIFVPSEKILGVYIGSKYHQKGYGPESLITFLDFLFNKSRYNKVLLDTCIKNYPAIKVYTRLGFKETKRISKNRNIFVKKDNQWIKIRSGTVYMEITKEDFNKSKSSM